MKQQTIKKSELFTNLTAEEASTVNGACHYYGSQRSGYSHERDDQPSYRSVYYGSHYYPSYNVSYSSRYNYDCY